MSSNSIHKFSLLVWLPIVATLGAWFHCTFILLLAITMIAVLAMATIFSKSMKSELYALIIFVIALSLLSHMEFAFTHLVQADVYGEYHVFRLVESTSVWNPSSLFPEFFRALSSINAMLSVTVLPKVFSTVLDLPGELVFKLLYLFVYSLVPVALYQGYRQRFGNLVAFLSSFYFMILPRFYLEERRTVIAELFLALLLFLILKKDVAKRRKRLLMMTFGFSVVVSHYASAYLFLFNMALTLILVWFDERRSCDWDSHREVISGIFVSFVFVVTFSYYLYIALGPSDTLFGLVKRMADDFVADFFRLSSRGEIITYHLSWATFSRLDIWPKIGYVLGKIPYLFIAVGGIVLIRKRRRDESGIEYAWIVVANGVFLSMLFFFPGLSSAFNPDRYFHASALYISPVCILGGKALIDWLVGAFRYGARAISDRWHNVSLRIVGAFLVVLLFFYSSFVYAISGDLYWGSLSLSYTEMRASTDFGAKGNFYMFNVFDQDIVGAKWLSAKVEDSSRIYADSGASVRALIGYGMILVNEDHILSNNSIVDSGGYVYLTCANGEGVFAFKELRGGLNPEIGRLYPFTAADLSSPLHSTNRICSTGGCEVYLCSVSCVLVARAVKQNEASHNLSQAWPSGRTSMRQLMTGQGYALARAIDHKESLFTKRIIITDERG